VSITYSELDGFGPTSLSTTGETLDISSATEGALLLLVVGGQSVNTVSTPAGWTLVAHSRPADGGTVRGRCYVFSKVAGASETSVTFTPSSGSYMSASVVQVLGSDATISASDISSDGTLNELTPDTPSISVAEGGDAILCVCSADTGDTVSIPQVSTWTEQVDRFGARRSALSVQKKSYPTAGTTGTISNIDTTNDGYASVVLAVGEGTPDLGAAVEENGFDIIATSTDTTPGNWTIKAGPTSSETTRTIQSILQISSNQIRIRLDNGERILGTDTVLASNTTAGVTDQDSTNNSEQTANSIVDRGLSLNWSGGIAEADIGITASGVFQTSHMVEPSSVTFTPRDDEEQYQYVAATKNPSIGSAHPFHPDADSYDAGEAHSFTGAATANNDQFFFGVSWADEQSHATSTPVSIGDVIYESGRWYRCTEDGTTAGSKPTFGGNSVADGTATWESVNNNSPVRRITRLFYTTSLVGQDTYAPAFVSGSDKTRYTTASFGTTLPTLTNTNSISPADYVSGQKFTHYDIGVTNGNDEHLPNEQLPANTPYGRDFGSGVMNAIESLCIANDYKAELLPYVLQQCIDLYGTRLAGGDWTGNGGWDRYQIASLLFFVFMRGDWSLIEGIRDELGSSTPWKGLAFGEQYFYVDATDEDVTMDEGFDYYSGNGGTFVNPANAPSTYSDTPSDAYIPATIQDDWTHVPEWAIRWDEDKTRSDPRWIATYRDTAGTYKPTLETLIYAWGADEYLTDTQAEAFLDYSQRYFEISGDDTQFVAATSKAFRDAHLSTYLPAYGVESASLDGTTLTVTFNRYTTGTSSGWAAAVAGDGSTTCSSATQTGPRTWELTLNQAPADGEVISYTAASGDAVDAGNTALGDVTLITAAAPDLETGSPTGNVTGAYMNAGDRVMFTVFDGPLAYVPGNPSPFSVTNDEGSTETVTFTGLTTTAILNDTVINQFSGDTPQVGDTNWTVSLSNQVNKKLTGANGVPIADFTDLAVTVLSADDSAAIRGRIRRYRARGR
jgi:hypothetical protein